MGKAHRHLMRSGERDGGLQMKCSDNISSCILPDDFKTLKSYNVELEFLVWLSWIYHRDMNNGIILSFKLVLQN